MPELSATQIQPFRAHSLRLLGDKQHRSSLEDYYLPVDHLTIHHLESPHVVGYYLNPKQLEANFPNMRSCFDRTLKIGTASGFKLTSEGDILTCNHVTNNLGDPRSGNIRTSENDSIDTSYSRILLEGNKGSKPEDIAIINIPSLSDLEPIRFRTQAASVGEKVFTIGTPINVAGMTNEITVISPAVVTEVSENTLKLDGRIMQGFSGGPVVDLEGNCLGMVQRDGSNCKTDCITSQAIILALGSMNPVGESISKKIKSRLED